MGPSGGGESSVGSGLTASGSALVRMGLTTVLARVMGPTDCTRKADELPDRAILEVQLRPVPYAPSTGDRRQVNPQSDRRIVEQATLIRRALEAGVLLRLHPRSRISIDITVLADDGGRLSAAINASCLALVDAGIPMRDLVCACAVVAPPGFTVANSSDGGSDGPSSPESTALIDPNRKEIQRYGYDAPAHLPVAAMPQLGSVVLAQCESRLGDVSAAAELLEAALVGCQSVFDIMRASLTERAGRLISAKGGNASVNVIFSGCEGEVQG